MKTEKITNNEIIIKTKNKNWTNLLIQSIMVLYDMSMSLTIGKNKELVGYLVCLMGKK